MRYHNDFTILIFYKYIKLSYIYVHFIDKVKLSQYIYISCVDQVIKRSSFQTSIGHMKGVSGSSPSNDSLVS